MMKIKGNKKGTQHIEVPTHEGWTVITDDDDILRHLNDEAKIHFRQAAKTAFMTDGEDEIVREVFEHVPPEQWADEIRTRISYWPFGDQLRFSQQVDSTILPNDIVQGFHKWSEETTTSPSGRHLELYKILLQKNQACEEHDYQTTFAELFTGIINIYLTNNHILKRWSTAHTVLIPKDAGSRKVHRFRNLQIYEADTNLTIKLLVAQRKIGNA